MSAPSPLTGSAFVETVLGPIAADSLGITLPHEHLFLDLREPRLDRTPARMARLSGAQMADEDAVVAELHDIRQAGVRSLVELTTASMGRRAESLRRVSRATGVNVVCATGFYTRDFHAEHVADASVDQLVRELLDELETGVDGTGIRAGIIKLGSGLSPLQGDERKCFTAGARAQLATGVPITTHTSAPAGESLAEGSMGLQHLDLFESEGVDPSRVIIGHVDQRPILETCVALARRGAYVEFDGVGREERMPDRDRADQIVALFEAGLGDRVLVSQDRSRPWELRAAGGPGCADVIRRFVPILRARGLGEAEIRQVLIDNPRHAIARVRPRAAGQPGGS